MRVALGVAAALAVSCSKPAEPPPAEAPEESKPFSEEGSDERELAEYPEPWDPAEPIGEWKKLPTRRFFVTAERSAVCPTREQAEGRECGNSVESETTGIRLGRGDSVYVVGDEPFDGHWRALRFQVMGVLPSWIRADDVAASPDRSELLAFSERDDVAEAVAIDEMPAEKVQKLEPGTLVSLTRKTGIELAHAGPAYSADRAGGVQMYVPLGERRVAVKLIEDDAHRPWMSNHDCLVYDDCMRLGYRCDADGYCDEVSILARVVGRRAAPPDHEDAPKSWKGYFMPLLIGVALADRQGTYEFSVPE